MVREGLLDSNQHENKWCCAAETSAQVRICRIHSDLDNISPHFEWYGKNPSIHELRTFGCEYSPSHHILNFFMTEHKKDNSWIHKNNSQNDMVVSTNQDNQILFICKIL